MVHTGVISQHALGVFIVSLFLLRDQKEDSVANSDTAEVWHFLTDSFLSARLIIMSQPKRSWLDGPEIPAEHLAGAQSRWPGEHLGLPERGPGALASVARRSAGVCIDWTICWIVAAFVRMFTHQLGGTATLTLMLFGILGIISVTIFARTPGQAVLGMGVARIDDRNARVGFGRAVARTVFTMFVLPAAMVDTDGRGMHDRATGTAVVFG